MPEEFDPSWEYFAPDRDPDFWGEEDEDDREITLFDPGYKDRHKEGNAGYSVRRNPNYARLTLGDERPSRDPREKTFVTHECPVCSAEHTREAGRDRVCCSRGCFRKLVSLNKLLAPKEVRCEGCRVRFVRNTGAGANTVNQRFCTLECWNKCQRLPLYAEGCPVCGGRVVRSGKGRSKAKVYCSRPCMKKAVTRRYNYKKGAK